MTKAEYLKLEQQLVKNGYRKYGSNLNHADYYYGKSFHKEDNQFDGDRSGCLLLLYVYDWTDKKYSNLPPNLRDQVGIEVVITISRVIEERIDLSIPWEDNTTIEEAETTAESFYQWACSHWPTPREN